MEKNDTIFSKCQRDLNCGKMKSVVLWSVLSSGYWFVEDFKTIISLSSQVMLRMPMSSFEADLQCNKEKQYNFFQLSNYHEWTKPYWTCLRNVDKKPVKIKQEFPGAGKIHMSRFGCDSLLDANSPAKKSLPLHEFSNTGKAKLCFAVAELQQNIVTGSSCVRTLRCAERFSLLLLVPQMFNKT